jgi:hypothetical protein
MASRRIMGLLAALVIDVALASYTMATEPAITTYGQRNAQAPSQLDLFSFLVGKWTGNGRTRLSDGSHAPFEGVTWIGRYILDGMAIADELHSRAPDGSPYLGISIRHFDTKHDSWIVEYLNVSNSFLRRQVNPRSGSVSLDAGTIVIISDDGQTKIRENYRVADRNHFTYSTDTSRDGGRSWDIALFEMTMVRVE